MPLLANLLALIGGKIASLMALLQGSKIALRIQGVMFIAGLYVAAMLAFSQLIAPWIASVFNTMYGQLLGLLFPPVAGTVMAALAGYWAVVISTRYFSSLTKAAIQ